MDNVTLVLPLKDGLFLLGMKKRGFGEGWWNGFGGKQKKGETLEHAAIRELKEESGLTAEESDLEKIGRIEFYFPEMPEWNQEMHAYLLRQWEGQPEETDEMLPKWFTYLPEQMWPADRYLFPVMLKGEYLEAKVWFKGRGEGVRRIEIEKPYSKVILP